MNKSSKEYEFPNENKGTFLVRITLKPGKRFLVLDEEQKVVMKFVPPTEASGEFNPETGEIFFRAFDAMVPLTVIKARWDAEVIDAFLRAPDGSEKELFT